MARSRSRMRPKTVAQTFQPLAGAREAVPSHRDGAPLVRVQTLGAARIQIGTTQLNLQAGMLFPLVLRLIYSTGMEVSREALLRELWPQHAEGRRRGNLRQALYKLRSMGFEVDSTDSMVQLNPSQVIPMFCVAPSIESLERDIIRGEEMLGPFVPGLVASSEAHEEWLEHTRNRVHANVRRVLVEQLRARRDRADWSGAEIVSRWVELYDPLNEDAITTLAECAMLNGSKAEAVAILDRYLEELGPNAGEIRLPATQLRRRFTDPGAKRRPSLAVAERHFVGRQPELAELTLALRRARWHDGSAVLLHGPPGIGKTRVISELGKVGQIEGFREVSIECREFDQRRPLGVFLDLVPELLDLPGALGCSPQSLETLKRVTALLAMAAESSFDPAKASDEVQRAARSRSAGHALVELFAALGDERPILLTIEDSHWLDRYSWELIGLLVSRSQSMRVFTLISSRFASGFEDARSKLPLSIRSLRLPPLSDESRRQLARAISVDLVAVLPRDVEDWIVGACEGTPLLLKALLEHWTVTGESGGLPPTLVTLIEQRLDRLSTTALRTLQATIVLGRHASLERLRDSLQLPTSELILALEQLEHFDCLATGDASLVVSHDLVAQVAQRRMTPLVESALRSASAEALEREFIKTEEPGTLLAALSQVEASANFDLLVQFLQRQETALVSCGRPHEVLGLLSRIESDFPISKTDRRLSRISARLESERGEFQRSILAVSVLSPDFEYNESLTDAEIDEQLTLLEAAYRLDPLVDREVLCVLASKIVANTELRFEHRLRAADVGLMIASNICDSRLADACFAPLDLSSRELQLGGAAQRIGVMYHATFGQIDIARKLALSTFDRLRTLAATSGTAVEMGRAAIVFKFIGDPVTSINIFARSREIALEIGAPRLAEFPVWQLAQLELEAGNLRAAHDYTSELLQITAPEQGTAANNYVEFHLCLMALAVDNIAEARVRYSAGLQSLPKVPPRRALAYTTGLSLAVELSDPKWIPSETLVDVASDRFAQVSRFCASDLLAAGLGECLIRLGRTTEAAATLNSYLQTDRRERGNPSFRLQRVVDSLGLLRPQRGIPRA